MKIQRDGKEYTLTAEEVMEAHEEFVTSFMAAELENSYDVPHKYSKDLAKEAYDMYADSGNYSEYDCIERVAKDYQDRCKEPTVTITWSECNDFEDGEVIPLAEANKRFELIDADIREQYGGHYYEKTKFLLNYNMGKENFSYEGRQDFGDYEGSLIDHLHNMALMYAYDSEYYDSVASSNTPELAEKIRTNGLFLLNKLVPYLRAHEEISDKSVTVHVLFDKPSVEIESWKEKYLIDFDNYVSDCRYCLNEINLEKASGMPDEEIKNGIKLPLATMQQRRETWGSQSKLDVQEPMIFILQSTVEKLSVGDKIPLSDADSFLIHQESGVLNYELHYLMNGTPQEYNAFLDLSKVKVADTLMDGVTHSVPPALSDYLERHQQLNDTELGAKRLQKLNCDSKNVSYANALLSYVREARECLNSGKQLPQRPTRSSITLEKPNEEVAVPLSEQTPEETAVPDLNSAPEISIPSSNNEEVMQHQNTTPESPEAEHQQAKMENLMDISLPLVDQEPFQEILQALLKNDMSQAANLLQYLGSHLDKLQEEHQKMQVEFRELKEQVNSIDERFFNDKQHIISTSDFKSFTQFMKACDGDYIIANLPTRDPEQLDKLMDSMTEVGITYCLLPDLDIQDSCQQIAIRGKDVAKWQALYESYVTNQLDLGGPLDFEELKSLTSGNYKIKSLALGDASEDNEQLEQFLDILDERGVNYSVLPDLKYGDNHIQIAVANQSLQQFAAAIKAYLEEFPDAAKDLVEDITEQEYFDSGRMSEEDYMKTASPEIKEKTDPKNWQKGKNLNAQSFEQALAGKEVDRYETLKNRPGLIERYIPSQRVAARREDEIALQTGDREYVRIQEALSVDNGKGFIIFLDPEKNYNVYRPDEKGILQTPSGSLSGKEFSKYTEQSDETHRLDYIPYAETETPSEAPQKQSSKAKSMEKTVSQSSPDVSTQEAAFPVTINRSLVDDIMDDKTFISRIPGSKLHIKLPLFSIADDGKTLVSAIDPQKEYEIFKNDSPTSNPLLNMKGAQILPYYDPVRRKNITKQFGQNQNKILKFSQNPASKHKPKSSPIRKKDLKL